MLSVSLGNKIAAVVNDLISTGTLANQLKGPTYFLFFAGLLGAVTIGFVIASQWFREKTYIQGEAA